jgi:hypothetical protein
MGAIIYWTMIRFAAAIIGLWILHEHIDYSMWWMISAVGLYGFVVHPALVQYRLFREENKRIIESSLCSSCVHFDESSILCTKHDEHVTEEYIPCGGAGWEPKPTMESEKLD